jgi:two-component system sensor histidine kinase/response regulator
LFWLQVAVFHSEIRTPIHGIIATSQLLDDTKLDAEQKDYVQVVSRSANALLAIVNSILDFSKIEAGRVDLEVAPFDVRSVVDDVVKLLQPRAAIGHNVITSVFGFGVPTTLLGDAGRIRQILINIIANSCKFTINGFVCIRVSVCPPSGENDRLRAKVERFMTEHKIQGAEPSKFECGVLRDHFASKTSTATTPATPTTPAQGVLESKQDHQPQEASSPLLIRFEVEDTGVGIQCKWMPQLFTPFGQADNSSTRAHGGTGLGLAIADRLVALMKGSVGVVTESMEGSTFWFDLPLPAVDEEPAAAASRPVVPHSPLSLPSPLAVRQDQARAQALTTVEPELEAASGGCPSPPRRVSAMRDIMSQQKKTESEHCASMQNKLKATLQAYELFRTTGKILVAEDNVVNRKVLCRMLDKLNWQYDVAENGQQAVDLATGQTKKKEGKGEGDSDRSPFCIILMDCQMPVKDGVAATTEIRKHEVETGTSKTWIIAVTADAIVGATEKYISKSFDDYISKPFNIKELTSALEYMRVFRCTSQHSRRVLRVLAPPQALSSDADFYMYMYDPP